MQKKAQNFYLFVLVSIWEGKKKKKNKKLDANQNQVCLRKSA